MFVLFVLSSGNSRSTRQWSTTECNFHTICACWFGSSANIGEYPGWNNVGYRYYESVMLIRSFPSGSRGLPWTSTQGTPDRALSVFFTRGTDVWISGRVENVVFRDDSREIIRSFCFS